MIFVALLILLAFILFAGIGLAHKSRARESPPQGSPETAESSIKEKRKPPQRATTPRRLQMETFLLTFPEIPGNGLSAGGVAA